MDKQLTGRPAGGGWQSGRTARTQRALLDAAREVFTSRGFADASIADVVERADSSVGSLYHHFGGKSELFLALWHEYQVAHEDAASKAVAQARSDGVTDTGELVAVGARAFLQGSWQCRDLALLFLSGDGPPGFEVIMRRRDHGWVGQNDALLGLRDTPMDRLYASVLTSLIGEGRQAVRRLRRDPLPQPGAEPRDLKAEIKIHRVGALRHWLPPVLGRASTGCRPSAAGRTR
jgi:AcrR family transcriptional regulator